ncbi:META domain-containing protein [Nocardia sp. NPDC050710]|uniref:META domain-containing protein n=1 Tax=Nocardia sp. NPDC050710 TaxID=3157220 RepID=UPI0033CA8F57
MSAHFVRLASILLLALGAAAACSSDSGSGTDSATPAPTPVGHTYISTGVEGAPIPGGGPLTLTFTTDRITAYAGCNTMSGTMTLDEHTLRVEQLASTLIGCSGETADADEWAHRLLTSAPGWQLDGSTLTLKNNDQTITLSDKKVAQPDKPLKNTTWVVTGLITPDAQIHSQTIEEVKPNLRIAEDGAVSGSAGCNRMTGTATVDPSGSPVTFQIGTTKMICPPEVMEVEQTVLQALDGKATATVDANLLTLRNDNGYGLTLRAE